VGAIPAGHKRVAVVCDGFPGVIDIHWDAWKRKYVYEAAYELGADGSLKFVHPRKLEIAAGRIKFVRWRSSLKHNR
jgi:hypothetical protein